MTRTQYMHMTDAVRSAAARLPLGADALRLPTLVCAIGYLATLVYLMLLQDVRLVRALIVPAACFLLVTALRPIINRQRPYDVFNAEPVGRYRRGKGKSMPSRHTASAAAIASAVIYVFPTVPVAVAMLLLSGGVAALRVLCGQHFVSDVLAALAISFALSWIGYGLL